MAISKQRLYRKYSGFPKAYRIIHLETSSDVVMRGDGETSIEDSMIKLEKMVQIINQYFDENGVLKPENGGSGGDNLPELLYNMIQASTTIINTGLDRNDKIGISDESSKNGASVTIENLAKFIATLITTKPFIQQSTPPDNHDIIWIDSGNSNIAKFYNGSTWESIKTAWA